MRRLALVCREIVRLVRPYLASEDRLAAWLLLAAVLALTLAGVGLQVLMSFSQRLFYTALQEKHPGAFLRALFWFTPRPGHIAVPPFLLFVTTNIAVGCLSIYLQSVLQLRWQRWLTARLVGRWLSDQAYYRLARSYPSDAPGTDNPDQRIQEDIEDATRNVIALSTGLLSSVASMVSFGGVLWALSGPFAVFGLRVDGYLFWTALIYAATCTLVAHLAGSSIARINVVRQRYRGDFRVSLVRVRENAEEIAMLRGEAFEASDIASRFGKYYETALALVLRVSGLSFLSNMCSEMAIVFPTVIAAPRFFSGAISFGTLNQIRIGFLQLAEAALWLVSNYAQLAEFVSQVQRLATFQETLRLLAADRGRLDRRTGGDARVVLDAGTVRGPAGEVLLRATSIEIEQGCSTAITGPSGAGKTTALRLLSGLRRDAEGRVLLPASGVAFVPQRAYFPEGSLRQALCYPGDAAGVADAALRDALATVGLGDHVSLLDAVDAWERRLSPGQQQRLAIARAILQRPRWLFLDEPTASLHPQARIDLHVALEHALPFATLVTVTHDQAVAQLHRSRIDVAARAAA